LRTPLICALATTLVGCSSQQSQPSCAGLNPLACLTAVHVPLEPDSYDSEPATAKPVSTVAWRGDRPPRSHADHAVRRTAKPIKVAAKAAPAVPIPLPSPQTSQQTTGNAVASEAARASATDPHSISEVSQTRTTEQQVAAASAAAERMSAPTLDASLDALVAVLVTGPDVKAVSDLAGKTIAIDDRYSESSMNRVRTAMAAAGALEVQLSKGQATAISRLVGQEVPAAVVGLVSTSAADSFPELARLRTFRVPLSLRSPKTEKPSIAHVRDRPQLAEKKAKSTLIEAKVEAPASGRSAATSDPVIIKAKTTIAAKLEDPASAEFGEMKLAFRKNTLGQSIDTICGRVKGKKASGEDTGERPFLYLVTEDEAYVVDGPANSAAASAYRNICS
jgi:hypothetical protein